jgi:heavy metal sensor kinase
VNTRSLRFRLIAWYAGWLTVLFVVFGFIVYGSLAYYLKESLREALARRTRQLAEQASLARNWDQFRQAIQRNFAPEANNRFTRITVDGTITYTSGPPSDNSFDPASVPSAIVVQSGEFFERRVSPDGAALLVVTLQRSIDGHTYVVEEGSSEAPLKSTLHAWLVALVAGLALLIFGAVLGGYFLVRLALKPVDRIIGIAERISSHNLSERLPVPETGDEIKRLSTALNHMIRRLDEGFQHTQRFLADASHELRTPLTIIRAEIDSMVQRPDSSPVLRELAASALEEVERLKKIVEGLLALSRLEAGEGVDVPMLLNLGDLATTTAEQMCLLAEDRNISISCHSDRNVLVEGSRARLKEVTVNLLDNAIKYTAPGGHIQVEVIARDHKAVLNVTDDGIGIPADAIGHVFERFYRVDKARSRAVDGAGLGLSIVQSICAAHGGCVSAHSQEGVGSRFSIELPLASGTQI